MSSSLVEAQEARARRVRLDDDAVCIELFDGRTVTVPLAWYPRLWYGSAGERANFEVIGEGAYIHWPGLDEDLSVVGILAGRRSGESATSLKRWLAARGAAEGRS